MTTADEVNVQLTGESDIPSGWSKTHTESKRPVTDGNGYYIYTYKSENFIVTQTTDTKMEDEYIVQFC